MLLRLSVSNFAIIDELDLEFGPGLTIITGETGAGKSILLGALRLILGERADLKQLKDEKRKSVVEAIFRLPDQGTEEFFEENELDYHPETILRRELLPGGRSRAFVNDTPVQLTVLKELGDQLIDIHSQFNTAELLEPAFRLNILDAFSRQMEERNHYTALYEERRRKTAERDELSQRLAELDKEADYKNFLREELENADLRSDEFETLKEEQKELENAEEIISVLAEVVHRLDTSEYSLLAQLGETAAKLQKISDWSADLKTFSERMESVCIDLDDLKNEIDQRMHLFDSDPEKLADVNQRLDLIQTLMVKHQAAGISELIQILMRLQSEQSDTSRLAEVLLDLDKRIQGIEAEMRISAEKLTLGRKSAIPKVEKELSESLSKLGMPDARLKFELNTKNTFTPTGTDEADFLFSANRGMPMQTVGKSVSGGERSRLMLAVKKCLAGKLDLPTLILDEIDSGVSGRIADEVGEMMKKMAENLQLISITHLPQVAAKANRHLKVVKTSDAEMTQTEVLTLNEEESIREIAGLLSGSDVSDSAIQQARVLMGL